MTKPVRACALILATSLLFYALPARTSAAAPSPPAQPPQSANGGDQGQGDQGGTNPSGAPQGNGNQAGGGNGAQRGAGAPNGGTPESPPSEPQPILDATLRTFAGPCIYRPQGGEDQAGILPSLAGLIPKFVDVGIDALTAALDKAGEDKVTIVSASLPLEHRPRCLQVARGVELDTSTLMTESAPEQQETIRQALLKAPFFVEFYLRQSVDGTALSVMPTMLRYWQGIDGTRAKSSKRRQLFATLSFTPLGAAAATSVTVPLGRFSPSDGAYHYFDPVGAFPAQAASFATGAAASRWIASPFGVPGPSGTEDAAAAEQPTPPVNPPNPAAGYGATVIPGPTGTQAAPPAPAPARPQAHPRTAVQAPPQTKPGEAAAAIAPEKQQKKVQTASLNGATVPYTVQIDLREVEPGSAFARTLSALLKGGKGTIVDALDPAKQAEAAKAEEDKWTASRTSYAAAMADYYKKLSAYCDDTRDAAALLKRKAAGAELLQSEITLATSARLVKEPLPFGAFVVPQNPSWDSVCKA